jgi:hypothetical protein
VFTHELGHTIGLAHSQTNGAVLVFGDQPAPSGCAPPFSTAADIASIETMYPFIDIRPGGLGEQMASVDRRDDIAALSSLYPTAGWPGAFAAVTGTVFDGDGITPLLGVNVVARNLADPFGDAIAVLSGGRSQGLAGPDGSFELRGLDPTASYVVYLDRIVAGSFNTPLGPLFEEEYWNDQREGADPETDLACDVEAVSPSATADLVINVPLDPDEPNDALSAAAPTACGARLDRILYPRGDVDGFSFVAPQESFVLLDVDAAEVGSTLDPVLGLFSSTLDALVINDDGPAPGEPSTFDPFIRRLLPAGSYVVAVSSFDDADFDGSGALTVGTFALSVDCFPRQGPPAAGALLGATGNGGALLDIDAATGQGRYRAPHGAFGTVADLVILPSGALLASTGGGRLVDLDPETGVETLIGSPHGGALNGLAVVDGSLYGAWFDGTTTRLVRVDAGTGSVVPIGATGFSFVTGLAWDATRRVLYGVTGGGPSSLVLLDLTSGAATVVGPTGFDRLGALALGPDGRLYGGVGTGAAQDAGSLITIDQATGAGTLVGPTGFAGLTGLAFVPSGTTALAIPSASPLSLIVLACLLAVSATLVLRR